MFFPFPTTKNGAAIWSATTLTLWTPSFVAVQQRTILAKNLYYNVEVLLYDKSTKSKNT